MLGSFALSLRLAGVLEKEKIGDFAVFKKEE